MQTSPEKPALSGLAWLEAIGNTVIDLLFPPRCAICHRLGAWFCTDCQEGIQMILPPVCPRCGRPLDEPLPPSSSPLHDNAQVCARCRTSPLQLDRLRACAFHAGPLQTAIHQLKYEDLRSLAAPLGKLMAQGWEVLAPSDYEIDIIVPVPLHPARQRQRGYNQAALLAREFGACLQHQVVEKVLVRTKATVPQVGLSVSERQANVHDAFRCTDSSLSGKKVLLVDDVCTTGSTLEAACAALRDGGATSVWAYTLARAT